MQKKDAASGSETLKNLKALMLIVLFVAAIFADWSTAWAAPASDIDDQIEAEERNRKELEKKIQSYKNTIDKMNVKANSLIDNIDKLQQSSTSTQQKIKIIELQIIKLQKSVVVLNQEMGKTQDGIEDLIAKLKQRMVDMYKYGPPEELHVIFSAKNTHDVLDSTYLLNRLAEHDQTLLSQLRDKKQEMQLSRQTLEVQKAGLQKQLQSLGSERQKYSATIKETNTYLGDIRRQKALAEKAARELEEAQIAVGQTILALVKQKKDREAAAKREGKPASVGTDYLKERIAQGRGSMFDWPVRGPISSPFGSRVHPVFRTKSFHSGLDVSAPRGTPVKAAAPGEVLFEGWMRGYGQVIIIDHGRDYSTVYAHMSSTRVKEGAVVGAGTVVGTVGNTGTTTGYHLHFEVRVGSTAKSPLDYLKR